MDAVNEFYDADRVMQDNINLNVPVKGLQTSNVRRRPHNARSG